MITIFIIKLKNAFHQKRLAFWFVVGGIFLMVFGGIIWQRYGADHLIRYVPADAVFYAHFNRSEWRPAEKFDALIATASHDAGIKDLPLDAIDREVAIFGQVRDGEMVYGVLVKTIGPRQLKNILVQRDLDFKFLSWGTALLTAPREPAVNSRGRGEGSLDKRTRGHFSIFDNISVYISNEWLKSFSVDVAPALLAQFLSDQRGDAYLRGRLSHDGLKLLGPKDQTYFRENEFLTADLKNADLILAENNLNDLLAGWEKNLGQTSLDALSSWQMARSYFLDSYLGNDNQPLLNYLLSQPVFLVIQKNNQNQNWFASDYDFYLSVILGDGLSAERRAQVELALQSIMGQRFLDDRVLYLSDGTRVVERDANPTRFKFTTAGDVSSLRAPDGRATIYYIWRNGRLVITNNNSWLAANWQPAGVEYIRISRNAWPGFGFWQYLKIFDFIETKPGYLLIN